MKDSIPKIKSIYEEVNSPENKEYLNKINSSKLKRNSSNIYLQNFLEEYTLKYLSSNKRKNSITPKDNDNISAVRSPRKRQNTSQKNVNFSNNLCQYLDKLYQNDKHLRKNILKKKNDNNRKHQFKVSFGNLTTKADKFRFNSNKLTFSSYINSKDDKKNKNEEIKKSNDNIEEEEDDGQSYGFNKKYSIELLHKKDSNKINLNNEIHTPKVTKNLLFNKLKLNDISKEGERTNKTISQTKIKSSDIQKLRIHSLKTKIKKSKSKPNFQNIKNQLMKLNKEQDQENNNNNVVNINYNINVNKDKNGKTKKNKRRKQKSSKTVSVNIKNLNKTEKKSNENITKKDEENINQITNYKKDDKEDNIPKKEHKNKKLYKFNCCFPFLVCLKGNNE